MNHLQAETLCNNRLFQQARNLIHLVRGDVSKIYPCTIIGLILQLKSLRYIASTLTGSAKHHPTVYANRFGKGILQVGSLTLRTGSAPLCSRILVVGKLSGFIGSVLMRGRNGFWYQPAILCISA